MKTNQFTGRYGNVKFEGELEGLLNYIAGEEKEEEVKEGIESIIENAKLALEAARDTDMESYFDGRLSAFEDVLDLLKGVKR